MIRIALCDNTAKDLENLAELIKKTNSNFVREGELSLTMFDSSLNLLSAIEKTNFDVYFIEVEMNGLNGIEVGKAIRKNDSEAKIVYTSHDLQYVLQSFETHPFNYLLKPIKQGSLSICLSQMVKNVTESSAFKMSVKTKEGIVVFPLAHIIYAEYVKPYTIFILSSGEIIKTVASKTSFSDTISPLLCDKRFLRPHISYVCNMNFVEKFMQNQFVLKSRYCVPISKNIYQNVKKTYLDFLCSENNFHK